MLAIPPITVLWDDTHIWGLMVLRALGAYGYPVRLIKGREIAQGILLRKQGRPQDPSGLLIVPGGAAALKSAALGPQGKQAIRDFIAAGGRYVGFCGGAGAALTHSKGIGLCPWQRATYPDRLLHLLSGHVLATPSSHSLAPDWKGRTPSLPVWWPGLFGNSGGDVDILARYSAPDRDFWIADIPVGSLSTAVIEEWRATFGVNLSADFLSGSELVVHGGYGRGEYILSYSHLETPASPDANRWLSHLLGRLTGAVPSFSLLPDWNLTAYPLTKSPAPGLSSCTSRMRSLMRQAMDNGLFFRRTGWLTGWKPGTPGSVANNLMAALGEAECLAPTDTALAFWKENLDEITRLSDAFFPRAESYIRAARLAETLLQTIPATVNRTALSAERDKIFGHPMAGGGILGAMLSLIEEYIFLCLSR